MIGFRNGAFIVLLFGILVYIGIRVIRRGGGKKEIFIYTILMVWCAYMVLSVLYEWFPMNTAELRQIIFSPVGNYMEQFVFRETPS